ncbi:hypothetical protein BDB01DRAFT_152698 [Pilobolus umbonatus]|nr:hypothetical protein BDB01DRAFT_152698 [Pilobolus umbonatus]
MEIGTLENKLESLNKIKQSFDSGSVHAISSMDSTMNDLKGDIDMKKTSMRTGEEHIIETLKNMMSEFVPQVDMSTIGSEIDQRIGAFGLRMAEGIKNDLAEIKSEMKSLLNAKADVSSEKKTQETVAHMSIILDTLKSMVTGIRTDMTGLDKFKMQIDQGVSSKLVPFKKDIAELRDQLVQVRHDTTKDDNRLDNRINTVHQDLSKKLKELISLTDKRIDDTKKDRPSSSSLQQLVRDSPTIHSIIRKQDEIVEITKRHVDKVELAKLLAEISSLTSKLQEVEKMINNNSGALVTTNQKAAQALPAINVPGEVVKFVFEKEQEINLIYNDIKMKANYLDFKLKELEFAKEDGSSRKKRKLSEVEIEEDNERKLSSRISALEQNDSKLRDFIVQFKDNVLDPLFPTRLEAALSKIENVLINHQNILSYMLDPFAYKEKGFAGVSVNDEIPELNPSMIDAINKVVEKKTEESNAVLQKQVKALEEQNTLLREKLDSLVGKKPQAS